MADILPTEKKQLRACMICSLIQTASQFRTNGCANCESILRLRSFPERVNECTSSKFEGMVAMMQPNESWVARWQRIETYQKGIYAIRVYGQIPEEIEDELERRGHKYRPRDGSVKD
ncbi:hypothetical protein VTP01DRAFT_1580 [Rhizomucor pusillus]|uniref:uncharacterized protein n=1 Tax=Rhizomucor pusillus TaxID=4840 RepID=UPI0037449C04